MKRQAADAANATKLRATAAAAKKHKAESASKRYDDAMTIQEAYIQAKRESYPLTVLSAEPAPRFAPNATASPTGTANLPTTYFACTGYDSGHDDGDDAYAKESSQVNTLPKAKSKPAASKTAVQTLITLLSVTHTPWRAQSASRTSPTSPCSLSPRSARWALPTSLAPPLAMAPGLASPFLATPSSRTSPSSSGPSQAFKTAQISSLRWASHNSPRASRCLSFLFRNGA